MLRIYRKISRYLLPFILLNLSNSVSSMTSEPKKDIPTAAVSIVSESKANKVDSDECVGKSLEIIQKAEESKHDEKKSNIKPEDNDLEQNSCKYDELQKIVCDEMQNMQQIIGNFCNLNSNDLRNILFHIEDFDDNLYKMITNSWLKIYDSWTSLFIQNNNSDENDNVVLTQNPVSGMSKKDAWEYALTLGAGQNHGSYKTMSAKDFMEWWAASNQETLTDDEKAKLIEISQPDNENGDLNNFYKLVICRTF